MGIEYEVLKILLKSNDYIPGSKISSMLGVSKATVSRAIKRLTSMGFVVDVNPRLGYKLANLDDLGLAHKYIDLLNTYIKYRLYYVDLCESTQDIADSLAREGASEGTVVIAEELTKGRGRMGRKWHAARGGLWISIIFRPRVIKHMHLLSLALGVAVANTLSDTLGIDAKVKWPNDVLVNEKKIAGILIEGRAEADRMIYLIAGIGINVNNDLPNELEGYAITIKDVVKTSVPRVPILLNLLKNVDKVYRDLAEGKSYRVLDNWRKRSSTLGKLVKVVTLDGEFVGHAEDIEDDGALRVVKLDGSITKVHAGDIIHIREERA